MVMKKIFILITLIISMISCEDNKPTLTRAGIISEEIVKNKMRYPAEVEFDGEYRGKEVAANEFEVYQKFTAKNAFGVRSSYVYKIHMVYISGEWEDAKNWTYIDLTIENTATNERSVYYGYNDRIDKKAIDNEETSTVVDSLSKIIKGK